MPMEKVSRAEAIAKGLSYYWSDKPCRPAGHIGFRRVKTYTCYECDKQRNREWHADNPDKAKERRERFAENNPGYFVEYRKDHPEQYRETQKRQRQLYPEKHVAEVARYNKRHAKKINAKRRARRKRDLAWAIRCNMASRLAGAVRLALGKKSASTMTLVGCTVEFLVEYLEARFLPGMTRSNYGQKVGCWAVDHITPCAAFDLRDPEQQRLCFHYTNLRPLWVSDNARKGAKIL